MYSQMLSFFQSKAFFVEDVIYIGKPTIVLKRQFWYNKYQRARRNKTVLFAKVLIRTVIAAAVRLFSAAIILLL